MVVNYFKLAWRNLFRKKLYSFINITGLGIASAFCILVYWYVQHESSFDKFHANEKQLYRIEFNDFFGFEKKEQKKSFLSFLTSEDSEPRLIQSPAILVDALKQRFPEIKTTTRIQPDRNLIVRVNNESFKEGENAAFVDRTFFKTFSFPLKAGTASSIFKNLNEVVLSEKAAHKYFGNANPIGKTIILANRDQREFVVSGIAKDFPPNSSFQFDLLFPRESSKGYEEAVKRGLNTFGDLLIVHLAEGADMQAFERNLNAFGKQYFNDVLQEMAAHPGSNVKPENFHMFLTPFSQAHYSDDRSWGHYTDKAKIYQLVFLALITLSIAGLNYILLTLTNTVSRSHEVGIRKTIGAPKKQIVLQFYIDSQLLAFLSVLVGFVIAILCLPFFSSLVGEPMQFAFFPIHHVIAGLLVLAIIIGIITGIYPAIVLSRLKTANIIKKFSLYRLNPFLAKSFGVAQFSICITLIISSLIITKQIRFVNSAKLGFDKDLILSVQNPYEFGNKINSYQLKERFEHYVASEPVIADITTTWFPFQGYNTNGHLINGEKMMIQDFNIDYNYFSFFNIPIIKGRNFSPEIRGDSINIEPNETQKIPNTTAVRRPVIVNEALYDLLAHPPLNQFNRELGGIIIGVCKNYHADDLTKKIAPAYHRIEKGYFGYFWIKLKSGTALPKAIEGISSNWKSLSGGEPFSYTFLNEDIAKSYGAYMRWMRTVTGSCILSIIIACLGLFGLSGVTTINRVKEIGIRKVLGASVSQLFLLLNRSSLVISIISFLIAVPVAFYLSNAWLQNFAYRINLDSGIFILGGFIGFATALIAVSYHTIRTAIANPVKSLRTE